MRFQAITSLTAAALLAGCASRPEPPAPPARGPAPGVIVPAPAAPSPAAYVSAAGSADLLVIRASELALQRSTSASDRRLAEMLIGEHRGMSAQLSLSGRRVNLMPGATLLPRHQARLDALGSAGDFASAYRRQMDSIHRELVQLHSGFAARGSSPTLRPVAAAAAAIIRRHLDQMR